MTIKITIEVDSENDAQFEELQRHIRMMTKSICDRYPPVTRHVSEQFTKEAKEVPEVKPGRWPRLRDITFDSRSETDEVVGNLLYILRRHGYVTVADVLAEAGKSSEAVDTKYGWTSLAALQYRGGRNSGAITLWLPTPELLIGQQFAGPGYVNQRRQNLDSFVLSTRSEAEEVLGILQEMIKAYGSASVGDLYNTVHISGTHADHKWGWRLLNSANTHIQSTREGYCLILPRPVLLSR